MSLVTKIYHTAFRRTSSFALTIIVGAFAFERLFDRGADYLFESMNRGKLWKDIRDKLPVAEPDEE